MKTDGVIDILKNHATAFSKYKNDIGHLKTFEHDIEVYQRRPIYVRPYKIPHSVENVVEKKITELVEMGILKECCSPWNFPLIPVKKKSGDIRLCVDYRRLNDITVKKVFSIEILNY